MVKTSEILDYIPIHTSDLGTFKFCRRKWNWVSPIRESLAPKVSEHGVNFNLWFGTGIHVALEKFHDPVLSHNPSEVWNTWYHDTVRAIMSVNPDFYDANIDEFLRHKELGEGMMDFYAAYSKKNDGVYEFLTTEEDFVVPLDMVAEDPRDGRVKQVMYCGRRDAIVRDLRNGKLGIFDHKTSSRIDEDFFLKLEMDWQCTGYMWATEQEREIEIDFVVYNTLRKVCPRPPTVLQSGYLSLDRAKESTTAAMFLSAVDELGLNLWLANTPKALGYVEYLREVGDEQFIVRHTVKRNRDEIHNMGQYIKDVAADMLNSPRLYPSPSGSYACTRCMFRAPCLAMNDGSDHQEMLTAGFERDPDR